jgi:hypothetical protein
VIKIDNEINLLKISPIRIKLMPMVGKKKFAYTKAGKKAAKAYAKKTGKKVK